MFGHFLLEVIDLVSVDTVARVFLRTTSSAEVLSSRPGTATVRGFLPPKVVVSLSSNVSTCFLNCGRK